MKYILPIILTFGLFTCTRRTDNVQALQNRIDSLKQQLTEVYKPGFGEFMSYIQAHHVKLWFAGQNQNWKLADFEIHEIMEAIEGIKKYETERKESQIIEMINPAIDSVNSAIKQKNTELFKGSYILLTNTCNNCHRAVDFGFNVVTIPDTQPFSNQDFKVSKQN